MSHLNYNRTAWDVWGPAHAYYPKGEKAKAPSAAHYFPEERTWVDDGDRSFIRPVPA